MNRFSVQLVWAWMLVSPYFLQAASPVPSPDDPKCIQADRVFMKRAYQLAGEAVKKGNTPFGAVLVVDGKIVAEFRNSTETSHDPTKHAETGLISAFSPKLGRETFRKGVLYTSSEPCVMCCGAVLNGGILKVVYGVSQRQIGRIIGDTPSKKPLSAREIMARSNPGVKIFGPLMEKEGLVLQESYWPEAMKRWKSK